MGMRYASEGEQMQAEPSTCKQKQANKDECEQKGMRPKSTSRNPVENLQKACSLWS